jgi:hypothetical protein
MTPYQRQHKKNFCGAFYKKRLPEGPPEATIKKQKYRICIKSLDLFFTFSYHIL